MTCTEAYKEHIEYTFYAFCRQKGFLFFAPIFVKCCYENMKRNIVSFPYKVQL